MDSNNTEQWVKKYASMHSTYESYSHRLAALTEDLLKAAQIDYVQIENRAKTVASFEDKISRKGYSNEDPFEAVTDLVGIRIITYYLEDVERVGELINREFAVEPIHSEDKSRLLASDQFGYRSAHHVARLGENRGALSEWSQFSGIPVEFQVRTALQHAWAAVSHKLDYKIAEEAPQEVRRRLFRLSALFELADEQFSTLRDESTKTKGRYQIEVKKGQLEIPVDASSLEVYLSFSGNRAKLEHILSTNGLQVEDTERVVDEDRRKRDRSDLVKVLKQYGFDTLKELDEFLSDDAELRTILTAYTEVFKDSEEDFLATVDDFLTQMVIVRFDEEDDPGLPMYTKETVAELKKVRDILRDR